MKKSIQYILLAVMIASAIFTVWFPIYIWPKEVEMRFEGVMFREGDPSYSETVSIELSGHINNRAFGGRKYLGKIIIDKMDVSEEFKTQTVQIKLNAKGLGVLYYLDETNGDYSLVPHAMVSMGNKGTSISLSFLEGNDPDNHMFEGSLMIAGAAMDREGAVDLSNRLMKNFLVSSVLHG